jgi:hypothetical protein
MLDETSLKTVHKLEQPSKHISFSVGSQILPSSVSNVGACTNTNPQYTSTTTSRTSQSREAEINAPLERLSQLENSHSPTCIQSNRGEQSIRPYYIHKLIHYLKVLVVQFLIVVENIKKT